MEPKKLDVLLMDNGEVLYMGVTVGFVNKDENAVKQQKYLPQIQISPKHLS